jgi:general secretion pathway protein E
VPSKILSDERTNTLILLSSEAGYLRVRGLVERLDVPASGGGTDAGSIHVYRLENANAEEMAQTLSGALSGAGANTGRRGGTNPSRPVAQDFGNAGGASFEGQVRITHDAPTNALVVLSSGRDFEALKDVVRELDVPRRQVFIEAVILELNVGSGLDLGTSFHGGLPLGSDEDSLLFGGVQSSDLKSLQLSTLASATGLISGLIGPILPQSQELLGTSIPSYAMLFQALAKSSNVNVLSSPHILATNNEEAEITVGQNIPYQGGINFGGFGQVQGGASSFGQLSIQRQDIELSMKITPIINASDMVRLKIEQQIQDVGDKDPQLGPTWTKRKIKTTVVVRDQQSVVIGGLISDRVSYTESKVPLLGDIPLLGYLFKYTKRDKKKTNLLSCSRRTSSTTRWTCSGSSSARPASATSSCGRSATSITTSTSATSTTAASAAWSRRSTARSRTSSAIARSCGRSTPTPARCRPARSSTSCRAPATASRTARRPRPTPAPAAPAKPDAGQAGRRPAAVTQPGFAFDAGGAPLLGELLVRDFGVAPAAIERALTKQRDDGGGLLGQILVTLKLIDEDQLAAALGLQAEMPALRDCPRPTTSRPSCSRRCRSTSPSSTGCCRSPSDAESGRVRWRSAIRSRSTCSTTSRCLLGGAVDPVVASPAKIVEHINKAYGRLRQGAELDPDHKKDEGEDEFGQGEELVDILDLNDEAPIIRWVNSLMFQAVKERASDIHIEPGEKDVVVRFRVDGALREAKRAPRKFLASILARVKIMAGLNIAEKRLPQDGRIRRKIAGKDVDMRVATVPTATGERITTRLLDRSSVLLGLADIGMAEDTLESIRGIIRRPYGILLVTGPTGSGKTTTLYACLSEINAPDVNILTVEDPVEYQLEGISQTQVNPKIELTFASGLRSFLRHDPDVIMVGEIRDRETAEIAITASLTGHFVFSTVHTNDAAGGITRLTDMNIEPFLIASSVCGLMAQRLVRRPCYECARLVRPSEALLRELGPRARSLLRRRLPAARREGPAQPAPRPHPRAGRLPGCGGIGYRGRTGVYEMLVVNDAVRQLAMQKADAGAIRDAAIAAGMVSLRAEGARKVLQGLTTAEEVLLATADAS